MNIPNVPAVKVNEEKKMQNKFIGRKSEKIVPFLDSEISIKKLSINQVVRVQSLTKEMEDSRDALGGIKILLLVLREGAPELSELSDEEIQDFPMADLAGLSNEIMVFSGLAPKAE
jgi:hypothetical protein